MPESRIVLGIVGTQASGKDTIADYLVKKYGFLNISTGDMIRKYIKDNNLGNPERDLLQKVGNELRVESGPGVLAERALKNDSSRIIVSGIRAIAEAEAVKKVGGYLISCDAPIEERYNRIAARSRIGDEVTFEKFKAQEEFEKNASDKNAQNIPGVMAMADFPIINDGTMKDLFEKIEEVVKRIEV